MATNRKTEGGNDGYDQGNYWEIRGCGGIALVHFRGPYLEVDLGDMRPANRPLAVIGFDGALRLHLTIGKLPIRYLVGSQTLIHHA